MKIKLDCSSKYVAELEDKLTKGGFEIGDTAQVMIIDNPHMSFRWKDPFENFKAILFMESFGHDIYLYHINEKDPIVIQEKLYTLEQRFIEHGFIRVNKSQIVNIRYIAEIEPLLGQKLQLTMSNQATIDVNRSYYKSFKDYLKI